MFKRKRKKNILTHKKSLFFLEIRCFEGKTVRDLFGRFSKVYEGLSKNNFDYLRKIFFFDKVKLVVVSII